MYSCCAGCDIKTSRSAQSLATEHEGLYFTAGVHPHNAKDCDKETIATLRELANDERCVAIGECGLDFNRNFSPPEVQEEWFSQQVCSLAHCIHILVSLYSKPVKV